MYSSFPTSAAFVPPSTRPQQQQQQHFNGGDAALPPSMNGAGPNHHPSKGQPSRKPHHQRCQQEEQGNTPAAINVKAFHNEEIRRLTLTEPSWERLTQRLAELFRFSSPDAFLVKWKDDEDDYITLDSDEELAQALRYHQATDDDRQLLRLYIVSSDEQASLLPHHHYQHSALGGGRRPGLQLPLAPQGHFTSFFTHATPYTSFAAYPPRGAAPAPPLPTGGGAAGTSAALTRGALADAKQSSSPTSSSPPSSSSPSLPSSASQAISVPSAPGVGAAGAPGILATSPIGTSAVALFASRREFKEQWKNEKRALKEQKYMFTNREEWKSVKKEQKKNLKRQKELAKTTHKIMKMEREFDPQDPKDQIKLYKLQQKQYKTTARALYARFVKHVAIPDGTEMGPDTPFTKTWRFRNEGTMTWPQEVALMFISKINGDQMGAPEFVPVNKLVLPGEEVDVSVDMISPSRAGHYQAYFRLCYGPKKFGQRVWIKINVACTSDDDEDSSESAKEVGSLVNDANSPAAPTLSDLGTKEPGTMEGLLQKLSSLGFQDRAHNEELLSKHEGDIDSVVDELLRGSTTSQ